MWQNGSLPLLPHPLSTENSAKYSFEGLPIACFQKGPLFTPHPPFTLFTRYAIAPNLNCDHEVYTEKNKFTSFGDTSYVSRIPLKRIPFRSGKGLSTKSDHLDLFFPFKSQIR